MSEKDKINILSVSWSLKKWRKAEIWTVQYLGL